MYAVLPSALMVTPLVSRPVGTDATGRLVLVLNTVAVLAGPYVAHANPPLGVIAMKVGDAKAARPGGAIGALSGVVLVERSMTSMVPESAVVTYANCPAGAFGAQLGGCHVTVYSPCLAPVQELTSRV